MTKEELIEFLKENLRLEVEKSYPFYNGDATSYTVRLKLGDDTLSEGWFDAIDQKCNCDGSHY